MWIFITFIMLTLTLIVHCLLTRLTNNPSQVFCFLCAGSLIGVIHVVLSFSVFGRSEETLVSILVYAASCQFILYLFSLAHNGVSISVLQQLSKGPVDLRTLDFEYSTNEMVIRRINQLQIDGFLIKRHGMLHLSSKGQVLVRSFLRWHTFFGHESLLKNLNITENTS